MVAEQPRVLIDGDSNRGTYRATYHYPSQPPSIAVPLALTEITDTDVTDLDPLYEAASVNSDALDDLFDSTTNGASHDGRVTFTYHDHTVMVKSHGRIVIQSPTASANLTR